ncbi:MAG: fumarate hydratase [Clostridiaceae bacterium]|nr:fumarate hydratase [Clostridiaceae bacterium]
MKSKEKILHTPLAENAVKDLNVGEKIVLSGKIYCGRDAVLPQICRLIELDKLADYGIDLKGSVIFLSAVSLAGLGPTSSNKTEIEESMPLLAEAGVKLHLGKGAISKKTIFCLSKYNSVFAVVPPITAFLTKNTVTQKVVAFSELGMEAFFELEGKDYPAIIAAAHNGSIYEKDLS